MLKARKTVPEQSSTIDRTRSEIFATAERFFAERGFRAVSIRDITEAAKVNVAAVHYHFGSKDALLFEIFRTRAAELNRERKRLLQQAHSEHDHRPPLRAVLNALFAPTIQWYYASDEHRIALQFLLRVRSEGNIKMKTSLREDVSHLLPFAAALKTTLPQLDDATIFWRLHFCLGLIHNHRPAELARLERLSRGVTDRTDAEHALVHLLDFAAAGFGAQ